MKQSKYCCARCGKKKSTAKGKEQKIEVHHKEGICNWDKIIDVIRQELLCSVDKLEALCPECHEQATTTNNTSELQETNKIRGFRSSQKIL